MCVVDVHKNSCHKMKNKAIENHSVPQQRERGEQGDGDGGEEGREQEEEEASESDGEEQ